MARPGGMSDSEDDDDFFNFGGWDESERTTDAKPEEELVDPFKESQRLDMVKYLEELTNSDLLGGKKKKENEESLEDKPPKFHKPPLEEMRQAAMRGDIDLMKYMLTDLEIKVDEVLQNGWSSLMYASSCGQSEMVKFLLESGADPNFHKDKFTPLMAVCASTCYLTKALEQCLMSLIEKGAKINDSDQHNYTPLIFACKRGKTSLVEQLAHAGANINKQDNRGWTALFWAVDGGYNDIVRILIDFSANVTLKNNYEETVAELAGSMGYKQLQAVLEKSQKGQLQDHDWNEETFQKEEMERRRQLCPELEMLLRGLKLHQLLPYFQQHEVNLERFLRLNEEHFKEMGIKEIGIRQKLEDIIKDVHKSNYTKKSLPDLSVLKYITIRDIADIIENVTRQIRYIRSSIGYVRDQINQNPRILELNKEIVPVSKLAEKCSQSIHETDLMNSEIVLLKTHLEQLKHESGYDQADLITDKLDGKPRVKGRKRLMIGFTAAACIILFTFRSRITSSLITAWESSLTRR